MGGWGNGTLLSTECFLRQVISENFQLPSISQLGHYWNLGKQFFGGQSISLLVVTAIPQVIRMTKDAAVRFSATPSTQGSAAPIENRFRLEMDYVKSDILIQEESF